MYTTAGIRDWKYITLSNLDYDFVFEGSSSHVADGMSTTAQISPVFQFTPGKIIVSSNELYAGIAGGKHSEYEWCIRPTVHLKPTTTYYFRLSGIPDPGTPTLYASLTTGSVLPVNLTNFIVKAEGRFVKISWRTSSERNNDHFDIQRSADGKTIWEVVTTIRGNGTTAQSHAYIAYDKAPLNGKNFYRLKQCDIDGKCKGSEIRYISMREENGLLTVFPNPVKENINFTMNNYNGNVVATLTDLRGKTVHEEIILADTNIRSYKLNLKNALIPGLYILQLKGKGLTKSSKVIIQ
jgi:hypothetical protein